MYITKEKVNLGQFILNTLSKEDIIENYSIYLNHKAKEMVLFNYRTTFIISHHLLSLYPKLNHSRINVGTSHFEIDGVEIEKEVLMKALEWWKKKLNLATLQVGKSFYTTR